MHQPIRFWGQEIIAFPDQQDLQDTIDSLPIGVVYLAVEDDNFIVGAINDAAKSLFLTDEDPIGRSIDSWKFPPGIITRMQQNCAACVALGESLSRENPFPLRDGSIVWSSNTMVPVKDDAGEVTGLLITTVDITDLVQLRRVRERELTSLASGFVKICAWCNSIRDNERWVEVNEYLAAHPSNDLHTVVCKDCETKTP